MAGKIKQRKFIHNSNSRILKNIREIVFGMEDGIVSTLGALTGIAIATGEHFTVIVSGLVIISVESISMGVGSYLSNKSVKEIESRKLCEEKIELEESMGKEKKEMFEIFCRDGWPAGLAGQMVEVASHNKDLMLKEMAYRELMLIPEENRNNFDDGVVMFTSYIFGGVIPLVPYLFMPISSAVFCSIIFSAVGLFFLGVSTSRFTNIKWWRIGSRVLLLGAVSTAVGFLIGQLANYIK